MSFEIYWKLDTQEPLAFRLGSFSLEGKDIGLTFEQWDKLNTYVDKLKQLK